jgi:hypothetical protein
MSERELEGEGDSTSYFDSCTMALHALPGSGRGLINMRSWWQG